MSKKAMYNLTNLIVGLMLIIAGIVTIIGKINLGVVIATIGLLIEGLKIIFKSGF